MKTRASVKIDLKKKNGKLIVDSIRSEAENADADIFDFISRMKDLVYEIETVDRTEGIFEVKAEKKPKKN